MLLIITGLSGAGKSTALHGLEDLGFFCTDNLPVPMLGAWAEQMIQSSSNAAVGMDVRSAENPQMLVQSLEEIRANLNWKIIFLDSQDAVLQRRFSTLKRKHPYAPSMALEAAISAEREALQLLRAQVDLVIDSSSLTPYQLADSVEIFWRKQTTEQSGMVKIVCNVMSFSYQRGLPPAADMVVDLRFLPNPHYEPGLAVQTGKDADVQAFFAPLADVREAEEKIRDWLSFIWPKLIVERKRYFTIAFGCSGGRHRSVYMTEQIAAWLQAQDMSTPIISHRELGATV